MARPSSPAAPPMGVLVFASGAAALAYQSLWLRAFGLVFGSSTDATAMVLAIFMGGLCLGSAWSARRTAARPLRAYALVEMGLAGAALLTVPLLRGLPGLYASLEPLRALTGPGDVLARGALAGLVLLPATLLLGATIPLAVEVLAREGQDERRGLGRLYLANTLGGAAGVLLVPFVLLQSLGLLGSFAVAAFVSFLTGAVAWRHDREGPAVPAAPAAQQTPVARPHALFGLLAAASGAFTFGIEVVWTRALALVFGSSVYSFAFMLLAVLLGLAAGALLYARLGAGMKRPAPVLAGLFAAAFVLSLGTMAAIGGLPAAFLEAMRALPVRFEAHAAAGLGLALLTLLPVTTVLGLTFPLLLHVAAGAGPQARAGRLYAWNTAGALAGALGTDLVLLGAFGLQGSSLVLSSLLLAAAAAAGVLGAATGGERRPGPARLAAAALSGALIVAGAVAWAPRFRPWNPMAMTAGVYEYGLDWKDRPGFRLRDLEDERRLLFYEEGRETVVAVAERGGRRFLSVGGKTDAGSGKEDVLTQRFIAHVPLLLHRAPKSALVIGWGAGATAASAALHPLERLTCVEIEPATFRAAPHFAELSGRVRDDPRFEILFRDGRTHLLRARNAYDVIVSEPSNPWITGVSNLFTREFYALARSRLAPGGVFGQWFHYYRFEPEDVKIELRTFAAVFPHVSLWLVPPVPGPDGPSLAADLLLVGSREEHALDWERLRQAFAGEVGRDLRETGALDDEAALTAAFALGDRAFRAYADTLPPKAPRLLNTDDHPVIELVAPRRNLRPRAEIAGLAQAQYQALAGAAGADEPPVRGVPEEGRARFAAALGERYAAAGQALRAEAAFERALRLDPSLADARERLSNLHLDRRDFPAAERGLRDLVRMRPQDVGARLRLGAVLARQAKWSEARDALREARALDPKAPIDPALLEHVERMASRPE